jgi:hypothetical protein
MIESSNSFDNLPQTAGDSDLNCQSCNTQISVLAHLGRLTFAAVPPDVRRWLRFAGLIRH